MKDINTKRVLKWIGASTALICSIIGVILVSYCMVIIQGTPELDLERITKLNETSTIFFNNGEIMSNIKNTEDRHLLSSDEMPKVLRDAYVSIEDERFYSHSGIDIKRIGGAVVNNIKRKVTGEGGLHGASTITQQLIKNTVLSSETSYKRKIREIYLSIQLEEKLEKDEILTSYLNTIPLGGIVYGVEAASNMYFNKSARDLTLVQAAYLAGITQAPTSYSYFNPKNKDNPEVYINRTVTVLDKMHDNGYINSEEYEEAKSIALENNFEFNKQEIKTSMDYGWVSYPIIEDVKKDLKEKLNYSDDEISSLLANGGIQIHSTINKEIQESTEQILNDYNSLNVKNKETFDENGIPHLQASATIMDPYTGEVIAMVGGRGDQGGKAFNRAYEGLRPIGSLAKPLTVYGPAINEKLYTAGTVQVDEPLKNEIGRLYPDKNNKPYLPNNWDFKHIGNVTVRDTIRLSKNVTSVEAAHSIGIAKGVEYGEKLGLRFNPQSKESLAAVSLGQYNNSPSDRDGGNTTTISSAFSSFVNEGKRVVPKLYKKVIDSDGNILLEEGVEEVSIWSNETAYIMRDMLREPIYSTPYLGGRANFGGFSIIGKTGTSTDEKDLWFAGSTPYYVGSVWVGYDTPQVISGSSGTVSANLWGKIMKVAHKELEGKEFSKQPENIIRKAICRDSGGLSTTLCRNDSNGARVYDEMFIIGTEPKESCKYHMELIEDENLFEDSSDEEKIEDDETVEEEETEQD